MMTQDALFNGLHSKSSEPIFHAQTMIVEFTSEKVMKQAQKPRCYFSLKLLQPGLSQKSLLFGQKLH